jgi:acetyl esterase/lipase
MRIILTFLLALLPLGPAWAQPALSQANAETVPPVRQPEIALSDRPVGAETWTRVFGQTWVRNVERPTLYPVRPKNGRNTGKAVIVVPGGGYQFVSIGSEGFDVAERIAAQGHTAFVLKYRPRPTPPAPGAFMAEMAKAFSGLGKGELPDHPPAVDDLAAAIDRVRADARDYGIDPREIGVIGFSAGSRTAIRLIEQRPQAASLDHVALIYPPMTQTITGGPRPDLFLAIAADDPLFVQGGLKLADGWLKQSRAVEFHLYSAGSHGFGMRPQGTTSDLWIDQYLAWLALQ